MKKTMTMVTVLLALCFVLSACALTGGVLSPLAPAENTGLPDVQTSPLPTDPTTTPTETTTPTPMPTATPTATPTDTYPVLQRYNSTVPVSLKINLAYSNYATPLDYFVALKSATLRAAPDGKAQKIRAVGAGDRFPLVAQVQAADGKTAWYQVRYSGKSGEHTGYIIATAGKARSFRLEQMLGKVQELAAVADLDNTVYVRNYKNHNGKPPALVDGSPVDELGYNRSQSAPAYLDKEKTGFTYVPDGMMGRLLESADGLSRVYFPSIGAQRWVPDQYLSDKGKDAIAELTQAVVVDRAYQNIAVFEKQNGAWAVISMNFISTGKNGGYSLPTPLGDFMAQEKVTKFFYYKDGTKTIDGYAPWGIRFCGGGYLHGVPRSIHYDANGKRVLPPTAEALRSLGTTPQSHMCVRNYTSHAKFMYDWVKIGSAAVLVIE